MPFKRQPTANGKCRAATRAGGRCAAPAVRGGIYCSLHADPDRAAKLGRKSATRRRAVSSPEGLKDVPPPKNAADLRDLLAQSIIEIRTGKMDPKMANAISYVGAGFLRAVELADIEARLDRLEQTNGNDSN